jgi:hypothetical protein
MGEEGARARFNDSVEDLLKLIRPDAEYSAAARAFLFGFRDDMHQWIQGLIAAA